MGEKTTKPKSLVLLVRNFKVVLSKPKKVVFRSLENWGKSVEELSCSIDGWGAKSAAVTVSGLCFQVSSDTVH